MQNYLAATDTIDWTNAAMLAQAHTLAKGALDSNMVAKRCFEFVRDEIKHSSDYKLNHGVTCTASEVLKQRVGFCYAKSHLLAALLRTNEIPTAFCYQRLATGKGDSVCLHGLNAIFLQQTGWYRVDARGNKPNVQTEFQPPFEKLAFTLSLPGEVNLPGAWAKPLAIIIGALSKNNSVHEVADNLPDILPNDFPPADLLLDMPNSPTT